MRLSPVALLLCTLTVSASAAVSLTGLKPGKTAVGPDYQQKDMRGKCTLVVYWGTH